MFYTVDVKYRIELKLARYITILSFVVQIHRVGIGIVKITKIIINIIPNVALRKLIKSNHVV